MANEPQSTDLKRVLGLVGRYDAWLWGKIEVGGDLDLGETYLTLRSPEGMESLTFATVISSVEPLRVVHERRARSRSWYVRADGVGALLIDDEHDEPFVVSSWPDSRSGIYHLAATVPATDRRWSRVDRWVRDAAPKVVPVYLDRSDFEGFVSVLSEHGNVDVSRLTGRYRTDRSSYSRGWPNPKSARSALEEVADEVQLRTMTVSVLTDREHDVVLRVHLRRAAGATYYSGNFGLFRSVVLDRLAAAADRRVDMFRHRTRTTENPRVRPIEVRVGLAVFDNADATANFLSKIVRYPESDAAVLHRNPYIQIALTDYLDGSNFDVFVTAADRITVFPGFQASIGSLVRFTDYLSEVFEADGVVDEAQLDPPSLEELFAPG